ncbi:hypothetical protein H1R20_g12593, partial [Candolleomyces eurysporus]
MRPAGHLVKRITLSMSAAPGLLHNSDGYHRDDPQFSGSVTTREYLVGDVVGSSGTKKTNNPFEALTSIYYHNTLDQITMSILITGGASQVGSVIAQLLKDADQNVIIGSRSGRVPQGFESVKLDWMDDSTFQNPFKISGVEINSVYLLLPPGYVDPSENIKQFIDIAASNGVKRFVLLSGSAVEKDAEFGISKVWKYLDEKKLDYFALRPTWFIDNFLEFHGKDIREHDEFKSVMPNAKIPLISVADIGQVALKVFLSDKNERTDQRIIGPELVTYDQVADILTEVLGRKITHKVVTQEELTDHYSKALGWPLNYAQFLVQAEQYVDAGSEERWWGNPENIDGKETVREWAKRNKINFAPASKV